MSKAISILAAALLIISSAVYTYVHEGPGEVRCDNVGGWFVVRP